MAKLYADSSTKEIVYVNGTAEKRFPKGALRREYDGNDFWMYEIDGGELFIHGDYSDFNDSTDTQWASLALFKAGIDAGFNTASGSSEVLHNFISDSTNVANWGFASGAPSGFPEYNNDAGLTAATDPTTAATSVYRDTLIVAAFNEEKEIDYVEVYTGYLGDEIQAIALMSVNFDTGEDTDETVTLLVNDGTIGLGWNTITSFTNTVVPAGDRIFMFVQASSALNIQGHLRIVFK